jgi:hypothetical protein
MNRFDIINRLVEKNNYSSYLEIGVSNPDDCFNRIKVEDKIGVDPYPTKGQPNIYETTSDLFFSVCEKPIDIIFVDGLHLEGQVIKDIENSLKLLTEGGSIVVHDCNPTTKEVATEVVPWWAKAQQNRAYQPIASEKKEDETGNTWYGTSWKGFVHFRMHQDDLKMLTVDTDCGCGIIQRGSQERYPIVDNLQWEDLERDRENMLNLISVEDWLS